MVSVGDMKESSRCRLFIGLIPSSTINGYVSCVFFLTQYSPSIHFLFYIQLPFTFTCTHYLSQQRVSSLYDCFTYLSLPYLSLRHQILHLSLHLSFHSFSFAFFPLFSFHFSTNFFSLQYSTSLSIDFYNKHHSYIIITSSVLSNLVFNQLQSS